MTIVLPEPRRFSVALSFAGEHRAFVEPVAACLASTLGEERVLYDRYHDAEFARLDLDVYLPNLYRTQSELLVLFLCAEYATKRWCRLEWRFMRQLVATLESERIMLLSIGDAGDLSQLGILAGDGYIDIGDRPAATIAEKILKRLHLNRGVTPPASPPLESADRKRPQASASDPARGGPSSALAIWREKLAFLQVEEAKAVDPDQKFRLRKLIQEAEQKIRELGGER